MPATRPTRPDVPPAVLPTARLRSEGWDHAAIRRAVRQGSLVRVRRGAFVDPSARDLLPDDKHRLLVDATVPALGDDVVLSHGTAAVLHGLPTWGLDLRRVRGTRAGRPVRSVTSAHARVSTSPLPAHHVTTVGGRRVTTAARTAVDLARSVHPQWAVPCLDAVLARELCTPAELDEVLAVSRGWSGICRARETVPLADARSESPLESRSRYWMHAGGLPVPRLQAELCSPGGVFVARVDFLWDEFGVVGECDGLGKYLDDVDGDEGRRRLREEKRRENAISGLGYRVVRWQHSDLADPDVFVRFLRTQLR